MGPSYKFESFDAAVTPIVQLVLVVCLLTSYVRYF